MLSVSFEQAEPIGFAGVLLLATAIVVLLSLSVFLFRKKINDGEDTLGAAVAILVSFMLMVGVSVWSIEWRSDKADTLQNELRDQGYTEVVPQEHGFFAKKDGEIVRCFTAEMDDDMWKITC